jgi:hypothetical protein
MIAAAPLVLRADNCKVYDRDHMDLHQWNESETGCIGIGGPKSAMRRWSARSTGQERPARALTGNGDMTIRTGADSVVG